MTPPPPDPRNALLAAAAEVAQRAHCPYSGYPVGAALLATDGRIFTGCNVENASYGLTLCAERNALAQAVAAGARDFQAVAVVAGGPAIPYPCGACRQVLAEFCAPETPVHVALAADFAAAQVLTLGELLPHSFTLQP